MRIEDILLIIMFIIAIFVGLWYLFGNSPTFEQTVLVLMLSLVIASLVKVSVLNTKFNNFEKRFGALAKDFKDHVKHK